MTFSFMDIIVIAGLWVSALTLALGIIKFLTSQIHNRINGVEKRFDQEFKEIRHEHNTRIDSVLSQIKDMMTDVKTEVHRATARMDEFYKTILTMNRDQ